MKREKSAVLAAKARSEGATATQRRKYRPTDQPGVKGLGVTALSGTEVASLMITALCQSATFQHPCISILPLMMYTGRPLWPSVNCSPWDPRRSIAVAAAIMTPVK